MLLTKDIIKDIDSLEELAPFLFCESSKITDLHQRRALLAELKVCPKKGGGVRNLFVISDDTYRNLLIALNFYISDWYQETKPESVHGFVRGSSTITNASMHVQKKIVVNVDIKFFFESITISQVEVLFNSLGFQPHLSKLLSELTTVNGVLATGFSTSPTISNYVCMEMDALFEKYSEEEGYEYTRYADDMTFSSDSTLPSKEVIEKILTRSNFLLNERKFRVYRKGGPQYVTGLTVVDKRPRLSKRFKKQLRLEAYYIKKHGFTSHYVNRSKKEITYSNIGFMGPLTQTMFGGLGQVRGLVCYIQSVEPDLADYIRPILLSDEQNRIMEMIKDIKS